MRLKTLLILCFIILLLSKFFMDKKLNKLTTRFNSKNKYLIISFIIVSNLLCFSFNAHSNTFNNDNKEPIILAKKQQKTIAVADFTNDTGEKSMDYLKSGLSNSLVTSLGINANDSFSIVERSQFESLLKEMGLASTGVVDVTTATRIGNALGATEVVVGGIVKLGNTFRLNIRVIDVKTSKLQSAFTEYTNSEGDILKLIDKIAYQIVQSLSANDPIVSIEQSKIPSPVLVSPIQVSPTPFHVSENNQTKTNFEIPTWVWISGGAVLLGVIIISNMTSRAPAMVYPLPTTPYSSVPSTSPYPIFSLNSKF